MKTLRTIPHHPGLKPGQRLLAAVAFTVASLLAPAAANAAEPAWPARPIKLVVPLAPGGVVDTVARRIAPRLSQELGQPVVVENRSGGDFAIGSIAVARSAPDGYTWLMAPSSALTTTPVQKKVPYDTLKDFSAVARIAAVPQLFVAPTALGVNSMAQFIARAKAEPNSLNYAYPGAGALGQLNAILLAQAAGLQLTGVSYPGMAPAVADLVTNRVHLALMAPSVAAPLVASGKLVVLALPGEERSSVFPDAPTMKEVGYPGVSLEGWIGAMVPAATPPQIVRRANAAMTATLKDPAVRDALEQAGLRVAAPTPPETFAAQLRAEYLEMPRLLELANIRRE